MEDGIERGIVPTSITVFDEFLHHFPLRFCPRFAITRGFF
jgi:hypothetical protein